LAALLVVLLAPGAWAGTFAPESGGSPNANSTRTLYDIVGYIAIVIFVGVVGTLGYALVKFRARRGLVPAQIHGNTRLEVGWTLGAGVILVVLAVVTFIKLSSIQDPVNSTGGGNTAQLIGDSNNDSMLYATDSRKLPPNGKALQIQVIGRQFIWQYVYPGGGSDGFGTPYTYENMVVPTGTTVVLDITSQDVVHSWWIPQLGGKFQAVPGLHNYSWFKIDKAGTYRGQCAEICGRLHARMTAQVTAMPPAQFDAWFAGLKKNLAAADAAGAAARAQLNSQTGAAAVENP
jgi:cytochrome c oxidase subunit 2